MQQGIRNEILGVRKSSIGKFQGKQVAQLEYHRALHPDEHGLFMKIQ